ncbi:Heme A synthase, cytochrome oxidase biogenesis protein Cox15-CtaA [Roseibacterium elongatum DSM 19469]|uniref:Heme A synthase n=1 Tax=Roseicyclus elongatus DSM 19469 TaxID=1294273 RepID=W8S4B1_9RHOB|nr:heme A synthase [Roseibacterium elongatum]AHM05027.1 Heme A synthase, cytochrome oxidase biogenesis protein Cox15-CtaA [Roseibacterium elongatum DSM 19469]
MAERRSIFEDVSETQKPAATPGGISRDRTRARRLVRGWLKILFALVVVMVAVGGLTRLTDSGLSITEWAPLSGAIPPLSEADWQAEFEAYRAIPEYQLQNRGMSMAEFQVIYWWEWGHRQLGRFIGLVWAVGFLGLLVTRNIPRGWSLRLLMLGALGGAQGAIGWWMVASGLEEGMLDVASYRLATHLGLAFLILSLIAWYVMRLGRAESELLAARREGDRKLKGVSTGVMHLAFLQIIVGALVAGIDAGRNYTDWPLMAGGFTPPGMWAIEPVWRNLFENDGTVQFIHRMLGYLVLLMGLVAWVMALRSARKATRGAFHDMMAMLVVQVAIGIMTVMASAPWYMAILHQVGAVLLMVLILRARFLSMYPLKQSIRG